MESPLKALYATILLLLAVALPDCHATIFGHAERGRHFAHHHHAIGHAGRGRHSAHHAIGRSHFHPIARLKHHRPNFKPGPWKKARATFYEGGPGSYGGACSYKDVVGLGYGLNTAALSDPLFQKGQGCGSCYEIKCVPIGNPQWCKPGQPSVIVTGTDHCPPNYGLPSDNGGWCNAPNEHFDLAKPVFCQLAEYKAGVIPVQYRRVPCKKQGGIRFTINGNPWFYQVIVWNVGGAGDVVGLQVKGDKKLKWTQMDRDWGTTWKTNAILVGESLTFRVHASDGRTSTSWHVTPKNWQFGQTFEGKNFK